jgi:hypothetical protein
MFIAKVFSFFFVCLLAVCGNSVSQTENTNQNQQKEKTELSLKMERSGCYGRCPIYDLTIESDGKVTFEGKSWTKIIGKAEDRLSEEKFKKLTDEIEKANFFSFDNAYNSESQNCPNTVTDHPSVKLYVKLNGKEKNINHYLGCLENDGQKSSENTSENIREEKIWSPNVFPVQLYNLENKIDEIVETKRWIGEKE